MTIEGQIFLIVDELISLGVVKTKIAFFKDAGIDTDSKKVWHYENGIGIPKEVIQKLKEHYYYINLDYVFGVSTVMFLYPPKL